MTIVSLKDSQLKALQKARGYNRACDLINSLEKAGFEAYLVGGCVRDVLLGRVLKDFDMCTSASPEEIKKVFKSYKLDLKGELFGTVSVVVDGQPFEITTFRSDGVYSDSRHPDDVKFGANLEEDVLRRDFTINALAYHPTKGVLDFVSGLKDLEEKVLRTVGSPHKRFSEDVLRVARLIRFAVQMNLKIDATTLKAARKNAKHLKLIARERVYTEFKKMLLKRPNIEQLDQIFGTSLSTIFKSVELDDFQKAYTALKLCSILHVSHENYVLEKSIRSKVDVLRDLFEADDYQVRFVRLCEKFKLFGESQNRVWHLVCHERKEARSVVMHPFEKSDVQAATLELARLYSGRELGKELFKFKFETNFS